MKVCAEAEPRMAARRVKEVMSDMVGMVASGQAQEGMTIELSSRVSTVEGKSDFYVGMLLDKVRLSRAKGGLSRFRGGHAMGRGQNGVDE